MNYLWRILVLLGLLFVVVAVVNIVYDIATGKQ